MTLSSATSGLVQQFCISEKNTSKSRTELISLGGDSMLWLPSVKMSIPTSGLCFASCDGGLRADLCTLNKGETRKNNAKLTEKIPEDVASLSEVSHSAHLFLLSV